MGTCQKHIFPLQKYKTLQHTAVTPAGGPSPHLPGGKAHRMEPKCHPSIPRHHEDFSASLKKVDLTD